MDFKVYVQSVNGVPISEDCYSAYIGFKDKGSKVLLFEDINDVPVSRYNIIVGYIADISLYLNKLNIPTPLALNIPNEIEQYAGRSITYMTMGEFKKSYITHVFVKPNRQAKEFVAGIVDNQSQKEIYYKDVPDDTPILVSSVVNFISEYRCYVIDGKLKGIYNYLGDIRVFPDVNVIDEAIAAYTNQPVSYAIDFGVTQTGKTFLVEVNDAWGIGNYGLNSEAYSSLLGKRWLQLMSFK